MSSMLIARITGIPLAKSVAQLTLGAFIVAVAFASAASGRQPKEARTGCAAEHYRIVAIPLRPYHVNNLGAVAGVTGQHHAALWTEKDGLRVLDLPAGFHHAEGIDINDRGHMLVAA